MSASETNPRQTSDFLCQQKNVAEFMKKICKRVQVEKILTSFGRNLHKFCHKRINIKKNLTRYL